MQDSLEEKLSDIKCESRKVEVPWHNIKKCIVANHFSIVVSLDCWPQLQVVHGHML